MNLLVLYSILLETTGGTGGTAGMGSFWIMILLLFGVMYLFMIRPQSKQRKEMEKFRSELKKGDKVVTVGGIFGEVAEVGDKSVLIKVDGDVKLRVDKNSLVRSYSDTQQ